MRGLHEKIWSDRPEQQGRVEMEEAGDRKTREGQRQILTRRDNLQHLEPARWEKVLKKRSKILAQQGGRRRGHKH